MEIELKTIQAKTRVLSASWTIESAETLNATVGGVPPKTKLKLKPTYTGKRRTVKQRSKYITSHILGKYNKKVLMIRKEDELYSFAVDRIRKEIDTEILNDLMKWVRQQ